MTKKEIKNKIRDFQETLVYEAQFETFKRKLLCRIRDRELNIYAEKELISLKLNIKNGKYIKPFLSPSRNNKRKKLQLRVTNKKEIKTNKTTSKYPNFNFKKLSYTDLSFKIGVSIDLIENILRQKMIIESFNPESLISENAWKNIKDFVINKIQINDLIKKKEEIDKLPKYKKTFSTAPVPYYIGGNFGKLIFIGKTN